MRKGIIFNIQKFSTNDGPGVRTTVFFKGCPLRCKWCANPESQSAAVQIFYDQGKCARCLTCVHTCPQKSVYMSGAGFFRDTETCTGCLQCVSNCPSEALSYEGEHKTAQEIADICLQDKDFYETSGGGVTISGGEAMAQPEFLEELLLVLRRRHIHLAIETTGYAKPQVFKKLAPMFDLLLFDVKHYDSARHYEGTCVHNGQIIENLKWAVSQGIKVLPRIPVIPDFNDSLEDASGMAALLKSVGAHQVQLLPFHQFGENKYHKLCREYAYENAAALHEEDLADYLQVFLEQNIDAFF